MARSKETIIKHHQEISESRLLPEQYRVINDALNLEVAIDTRDELKRIADILQSNSAEGEFQVRSHN